MHQVYALHFVGDKCLMCFSKHLAKFAMLIQLALLLLCYGVGNVHCVHENSKDLQSLLDFKQGVTTDPNRALSSWNTSVHYCRWSGVMCTPTRPWRVSALNLTGKSLAGEITSSLINLTLLSQLDLSSNSFYGQLPPLGGLQLLQTIYLNNNSLDGTIPDALTNCSNLVNLDLHSNKLSGVIPPKIGLLSNLDFLDLSSNNLTGVIPPTFPNLTRLSFCRLRSNQLEGSIPDGLWQMSNMGLLLLGNNTLSGEIPRTINMSRLQVLALDFNRLGKTLPSNFGDVVPRLTKLALDANMFEGHIPASLGNASSLQLIDLSVNHFTGQIPASLGKLSSLNFLNLESNQLETWDSQSWEFLHALSNCRDLHRLSLYDNRLQGVIPDSIGNLSVSLERLLLGRNYLSGILPKPQ
ncbi:hypothetical protein SETIT_1G227300v2 [Setaria italica]|uniref:Leucine-rich repeat-containing N-terminal plant-type domain-containing protein n=2 Tax=Setaria italica TaxID=4555 RepID=A0A368PP64_SETIT|nr:hypothetical protein SETIT_1G227300v2 [Setaria italica]